MRNAIYITFNVVERLFSSHRLRQKATNVVGGRDSITILMRAFSLQRIYCNLMSSGLKASLALLTSESNVNQQIVSPFSGASVTLNCS